MPEAPTHAIDDLTCSEGELSFHARIAGAEPRRVWYRTATAVIPTADAALATCLMPAMRSGGALRMSDPVSPRVLRNQREFQAIQRAWSFGWPFGEPPLEEVEVSAPTRAVEPRRPSGRVAAFFSGGVDSWSTVIENPDVTDLIFVRGIDILPRLPQHEGLADEVEARLREAAAELGLPLHVVETNLRELSDPLLSWETYTACALAALALFFEPLFDRVLIPGDTDHETQAPMGASRLVDQLWSTEGLEIVDDGGRLSREQRLQRIVGHPVVQRTLRVCWENPGGAYNCGSCRKCMLTKISLEAIGAREQVTTFPRGLDLDLLADYEMSQMIQLVLWEDLLHTVRERGRTDLERAVEPVVVRGKRSLGLPRSYRTRLSRGAPAAKQGLLRRLRRGRP
jgi:hypothetical protein